MRMIKAKVLATGEELFLVEKESEPGVFTKGLSNIEFKADELEILNETDDAPSLGCMPPIPKYEPLETASMIKEMMDSLKGHFWRDQRVEIVKILLRREDADFSHVAEKADEIIQKLKAFGD